MDHNIRYKEAETIILDYYQASSSISTGLLDPDLIPPAITKQINSQVFSRPIARYRGAFYMIFHFEGNTLRPLIWFLYRYMEEKGVQKSTYSSGGRLYS